MPTNATEDEVMKAFEDLSPADILNLGLHAKALMRIQRRSPYTEAADLISESLHRALEGRRKWPKNIAFKAFMSETMRSVINHDTDNLDNKPGVHAPFDLASVESHQWASGVCAPSAEDEYAAAEEAQVRIAALEAADRALKAEGDVLARHVLRGMVEELTTVELIAKTNASPKELAAARKRVHRRLTDAIGAPRSLH